MTDQEPVTQTGAGAPPLPTPLPPPPKASRRWLLPVSLALNLLVAGIVGGAAVRHALGDGRPMMVRDLAFGPFTEALSPEDRAELRRSFLSRAGDLRDLRPESRTDFNGLLVALRATPFDLGAVRDLMAAQSDRMAERLGLGRDLLVERIAAMSDAERSAFAGRLEAAMQHRPGDGERD